MTAHATSPNMTRTGMRDFGNFHQALMVHHLLS